MMVGTLGIPKSCLLLETHNTNTTNANGVQSSLVTRCSQKHENKMPKLEPFSRSKMDRALKDPPLIQKSQNQLADYCTVLEGENSYSCWQAYFELKDLEKESPKEEVERLIIEAGGVKSLIGCVHGVAAIHKAKKVHDVHGSSESETKPEAKLHMHIPDGLPKTAQEIEEEETAKMPDSAYTRLLRVRGTHPAWYSPAPDHLD